MSESIEGHETEAREASWRPRRDDLLAAGLCLALGLLLSLLPHLIWWARTGDPTWLQDDDEIIYLAYTSRAYERHPAYLSDVVQPKDHVVGMSGLQYLPCILVARALGLGPMMVSILWRAAAGIGMAITGYVLIRFFVKRPWVAAALTMILLADPGVVRARPLVRQATRGLEIARGDDHWLRGGFTSTYAQLQWRVPSPGVIMPFLLLFVWLLSLARERPSRGRIAAAGVGFGVLFYCYLFYWTAAGLALLLGLCFDAGRRKMYFLVGVIGGLIGLPTIVEGFAAKAAIVPEAIHRINIFLPIRRTDDLFFSRPELALLMVAVAWVVARRRGLMPLALLGVSGWLLMNHQLLTRLQIQNYHFRTHIFGPAVSLVLLISATLTGLRRWPRGTAWALALVAALDVGIGCWSRALEATNPATSADPSASFHTSADLRAGYRHYRDQRSGPSTERLKGDSVVGGDPAFVDWAMLLEDQRPLAGYTVYNSTSVDTASWNARVALNAYLEGRTASEFEAEQRPKAGLDFPWGPWRFDPALRAALLADRFAAYARAESDPAAALDRLGVRYVGLPAAAPPPAYLARMGWRRLQAGPYWQVWERAPQPVAPPSPPPREPLQ